MRQAPVMACLLVAAFVTDPAAQRQADTSLQQLYDGGRWFDLQDAVRGRDTSPLFSGAINSAFNRVEDAERDLRQAIQRV